MAASEEEALRSPRDPCNGSPRPPWPRRAAARVSPTERQLDSAESEAPTPASLTSGPLPPSRFTQVH